MNNVHHSVWLRTSCCTQFGVGLGKFALSLGLFFMIMQSQYHHMFTILNKILSVFEISSNVGIKVFLYSWSIASFKHSSTRVEQKHVLCSYLGVEIWEFALDLGPGRGRSSALSRQLLGSFSTTYFTPVSEKT